MALYELGDCFSQESPSQFQKYYNDSGEVGVIISGGFGAGWSTWEDNSEILCMDKVLVEYCLEGVSEEVVKAYLKSAYDDTETYTGGWSDCRVVFLEVGTQFVIDEYDGAESIQIIDEIEYYTA